ncbi:DUF3318 domain-containing protein [Ancylothrix sp. C2]|uniref:DUF3318 domain-containing protein n=1 Tax=Ancylothrix sp. D3o TaxID=2953691 RepID=UPI0021BA721F|nr:DUF3318 domain-containing protein [Ancylothrix sp. D3o]MCT7950832.1 DUF3318 domain-containing protein [Ancylothrix sp. D3o]
MDQDSEIQRLLDLLPASSRMRTKIVNSKQQKVVIETKFPMPWAAERPILINFDLWRELPGQQRDLLLLRSAIWLSQIRWLKFDLYQGLIVAGIVGTLVELVQADVVGTIVGGGLSVVAGGQIWRSNRSSQVELQADEEAIRVAQRRGYSPTDAASFLLKAIESVAIIEGRSALNFTELIRCQNLRMLAGLSSVDVPDSLKR